MGIQEQTFSCAGLKKISLRKQQSENQSYFLPEDEQTKYQKHFVVSPQDQSTKLATSSVAIEDVPVMIGTVRVDDDDTHDVKDDNDNEEEEGFDQDVQNALYEVWQRWPKAREA